MRKLIHFDSETIMGKFKYPFFSKIQFSTNHRYRKIIKTFFKSQLSHELAHTCLITTQVEKYM